MLKKYRVIKILEILSELNPNPKSELNYSNAYELLIAVILSAQCTDKRVNIVTQKLFKTYPNPFELKQAKVEDVFDLIKSVSYPNNKAKHLIGAANLLVDKFNGEIPDDVELLETLPGVGRKTANVIASVIFKQAKLAVDTHVFRVAARIGLTTNSKTPLETEKQLMKIIPENLVADAHHWLILHGRYICLAKKPKCMQCPITQYCKSYNKLSK